VSNQIPPDRRVTLTQREDGVYVASYVWKLRRFLMDDGSTVDCLVVQDDSDLRAAVLDLTKAERIEGVARLPYPEPEPEQPRRVVRKRAAKAIPG
jgi:hypothetical protein